MFLKLFWESFESREDFLLERFDNYASETDFAAAGEERERGWDACLRRSAQLFAAYLQACQTQAAAAAGKEAQPYAWKGADGEEARWLSQLVRGRLDLALKGIKAIRGAFIDLVEQAGMSDEQRRIARSLTLRFFDELELSVCSWPDWRTLHDATDGSQHFSDGDRTSCNALRESEDRYKGIFENTKNGVVVYEAVDDGSDFVFVDFNRSAERIEGIERENVIGRRITEVFPGAGELGLLDVLRKAWSTGKPQGHPTSFYKDSRISGWRRCYVYKLPSGEVVNIYSDETKRKRGEEALRESEARFRGLVEQLPDTVTYMAALDETSTTLYVSPQIERIIGYSLDEYLSDPDIWAKILHPEDASRVMAEVARCHQSGTRMNTEYRVIRKDGSVVWLQDVADIIRSPDGTPLYLLGVNTDVTWRRAAQDALRESELAYRTLAENLPGIVFRVLVREQCHTLFFNDVIEDISGFTPNELTQGAVCSLDPLIIPEDRERVIEVVKNAVSLREPYEVEYWLRRQDGLTVHCLERGKPIFGADDELLYIDGVILDTTEQKRLEGQLRQAQKMEALGTLAGGIAHDFNNILAAIMGYSEMAAQHIGPSHRSRYDIEQVLRSAYRAKDLVKQILLFSRRSPNERKQPMVLGTIVREALKLLRATLPTTIQIRQTLTARPGVALADPTQIHQVVVNLCTNAAHAMRESGGILDVSLTDIVLDVHSAVRCGLKPGPFLRLTVEDTGEGMDAAVMERVFDPYFTTKIPGEGTGLGLAVVQGIVKNHGGAIMVRSERGVGTAVIMYIPSIEGDPKVDVPVDENLPAGTERILFVDDESMVAELGRRMLEQLGYRVKAMTNSVEALETFRSAPSAFDLVITDYTMPNLTGGDLARSILSLREDIPIVLCTGFSERITPESARKMGIAKFVLKPVALRDLAHVVRDALDGE